MTIYFSAFYLTIVRHAKCIPKQRRVEWCTQIHIHANFRTSLAIVL